MGDLSVWFQYERSEVTNPGYSDWKLKKRKQFHPVLVGWTNCAIRIITCAMNAPAWAGIPLLLLLIWAMFKSEFIIFKRINIVISLRSHTRSTTKAKQRHIFLQLTVYYFFETSLLLIRFVGLIL